MIISLYKLCVCALASCQVFGIVQRDWLIVIRFHREFGLFDSVAYLRPPECPIYVLHTTLVTITVQLLDLIRGIR